MSVHCERFKPKFNFLFVHKNLANQGDSDFLVLAAEIYASEFFIMKTSVELLWQICSEECVDEGMICVCACVCACKCVLQALQKAVAPLCGFPL